MKVSVIIPAHNEEEAISYVLNDIDQSIINEVIVVDNGSTDKTGEIATKLGAIVLKEERMGYGWACLGGMAAMDNPDIVVFLDGDYSDYPDMIENLIEPIVQDKADFVIGSRTMGDAQKGSLTMTQRYGNWLAARLLGLLFNVKYTDLGPFRAIRRDVLEKMKMNDKKYGWTIEMQIKAAFMKVRTIEIPVPYRKRIYGKSKVSGTVKGVVLASIYILYYIIAAAMKRISG